MSDTAPEAAEPDGGFDGGFGAEVEVWAAPGELEPEIIDAEIMDDEPEADPELIGNAEIEPWAVGDDPGDWGYGGHAKAPEQRQSDHDGARPGGGPNGGGGGFTGKMSRRERKRRQRAAGGGGGSGVHVSLFGGVLTNASVVRTGAVASGNSAAGLFNGPARSTRGSGSRSTRGSKK